MLRSGGVFIVNRFQSKHPEGSGESGDNVWWAELTDGEGAFEIIDNNLQQYHTSLVASYFTQCVYYSCLLGYANIKSLIIVEYKIIIMINDMTQCQSILKIIERRVKFSYVHSYLYCFKFNYTIDNPIRLHYIHIVLLNLLSNSSNLVSLKKNVWKLTF